MSTLDDDATPGHTGTGADIVRGVRVYPVAAVASVEIVMHEVAAGAGNENGEAVWMSFMSNVPFFIITGVLGTVLAAPDPTAIDGGVSQDSQCIRIPADYEWMRKWTRTANIFRIVRDGPDDGFVRVERTSFVAGVSNKGV